MAQVMISHKPDFGDATTVTVEDMSHDEFAALLDLWRSATPDNIYFTEGITPTSGGVVVGQVIRLVSVTAVEEM